MKKIKKLLNKVPYWLKALLLFVFFPLVVFSVIIWVMMTYIFKKRNTRPIAY